LFSAGAGGAADETEAILSHALWQERFSGRNDILGRTIVLDGCGYRIVGVMPAGFPDRDTRVWLAFRIRPGGRLCNCPQECWRRNLTPLTLLLAAAIASSVPALRAARLDSMIALRR